MAEAVTTTILEDIVVLSMGRVTEVAQNASIDPRATRPQSQAATLLVTPEQARKVELAKNQGKVSLSLRNPLDHAAVGELRGGKCQPSPGRRRIIVAAGFGAAETDFASGELRHAVAGSPCRSYRLSGAP